MARLRIRQFVIALFGLLVAGESRAQEYRSTKIDKSLPVPLEKLGQAEREQVQKVMSGATISTSFGPDRFFVNDELYRWMLDHPDRVGLAWRRVGVPAVDIIPHGEGKFSWTDDQGSELTWTTVGRSERGRIWFAEGKVKPGPLMPLIPVKAVAIIRHEVIEDAKGRTAIRHSLEAHLLMESKFAALVTRILGPAAPRMAEQAADQLLYYFSGMAKHLDANPEKAPTLLAPARRR